MLTTFTNYPILQPAIGLLQHVLTDYSVDSVIIPNFEVLLDTLLSLSTKNESYLIFTLIESGIRRSGEK